MLLADPSADLKRIEQFYADAGSLGACIASKRRNLERYFGPDSAASILLGLVREASIESLRSDLDARPRLESWRSLTHYLHARLAHEKCEWVLALYLNSCNALIGEVTLANGTVDHAVIHPRTVIEHALDLGAAALILVHNHPSGNPEPSRADIQLTRDIAGTGRILGIALHDHLIIASGGQCSMRARGLL